MSAAAGHDVHVEMRDLVAQHGVVEALAPRHVAHRLAGPARVLHEAGRELCGKLLEVLVVRIEDPLSFRRPAPVGPGDGSRSRMMTGDEMARRNFSQFRLVGRTSRRGKRTAGPESAAARRIDR